MLVSLHDKQGRTPTFQARHRASSQQTPNPCVVCDVTESHGAPLVQLLAQHGQGCSEETPGCRVGSSSCLLMRSGRNGTCNCWEDTGVCTVLCYGEDSGYLEADSLVVRTGILTAGFTSKAPAQGPKPGTTAHPPVRPVPHGHGLQAVYKMKPTVRSIKSH